MTNIYWALSNKLFPIKIIEKHLDAKKRYPDGEWAMWSGFENLFYKRPQTESRVQTILSVNLEHFAIGKLVGLVIKYTFLLR